MKTEQEMVLEQAQQDLKLSGTKGCNIAGGRYRYNGKLAEQIRLECDRPESLVVAKLVLDYIKWTDLTPTMAASGDGL